MSICKICKKEIDYEGNYTEVTDIKKGKEHLTNTYHTKCLNDLIIGNFKEYTKRMKKGATTLMKDIFEGIKGVKYG